jgi:ABC-type multidrug transport system fused ATPase/permease subunit
MTVAFLICSLTAYVVATKLPHEQALLLLGVYAGACFRIIPSVNRILLAVYQIRTHEHILQELGPDLNNPIDLHHATVPFTKALSARGISFGYAGQEILLRSASMTIQKGERVAITGNSGGGKTTFLLLLMGFLKPQGGEIVCDNHVIRDHTIWSGQIGYVPQNPILLNLSIAENIAFGCPPEEIDLKKIKTLLDDVHLTALVENLPDGTSTMIGENGVKFSGGQRQRLAIARALYHDAVILLLDEVTNQVQPQMERDILSVLSSQAAKGKTIVTVTHKVTYPEYFDSIYALENGKFISAVVTT